MMSRSRPLMGPLLLLLGLALLHTSSARTLQQKTPSRALLQGSCPKPDYPVGDCPTQCTNSPAPRSLKHCNITNGDPVTTTCSAIDSLDVCPTLRYLDAFQPENYCIPDFKKDCADPVNIGCYTRCILWVIITHKCEADAYSKMIGTDGTFNASCINCNMCWNKANSPGTAKRAPYALLRARGDHGGLYENHYLVLPTRPCTGIESTAPGCTDRNGEYIWSNVWKEATALGFKYTNGAPDWAIMLNAPNHRGNHQMHIHIANFDTTRPHPVDVPYKNYLTRRLAAAEEISIDENAPTRILGEGLYDPTRYNFTITPLGRPPKDWARAYVVFRETKDTRKELATSIKPFALARKIAAASDTPYHSYGIIIMPRKFGGKSGVVIGITWSTDDWEQLDQSELEDDPIKFNSTCNNYIGV